MENYILCTFENSPATLARDKQNKKKREIKKKFCCYTLDYSLLQEKEIDLNQSSEDTHWVEFREIPNMELPLPSPCGIMIH